MKILLICLLLIAFAANKEIKCQPNEAIDEQTQKCKKVCEEGKVFNSDTSSCELNSTNTTCPEGQIFNNCTSSCEHKKVDTTTKNDDGTRQDVDGTTKDGNGTTKDDNTTRQDDDHHELVFNIKLKENKRTLRKLEEEKQRIFIIINGAEGANVKYINSYVFSIHQPAGVYLNDNKDINFNNDNSITLNKDGENKIEVVWNNKLTTFESMFDECDSIISLDLSHFDTSNAINMQNMFKDCW